jgi:hypothetical protein
VRWTFRPAGDLFVVYNHNLRTLDPLTRDRQLRFTSNQLLVKLQYALQYSATGMRGPGRSLGATMS